MAVGIGHRQKIPRSPLSLPKSSLVLCFFVLMMVFLKRKLFSFLPICVDPAVFSMNHFNVSLLGIGDLLFEVVSTENGLYGKP